MLRTMNKFIGLALIGLVACQSGVRVQVPFEATVGLKTGDPVVVGDAVAGRVESIGRTDDTAGSVTVTLVLDAARAADLRSGAAAMIVRREDRRQVHLFNSPAGERLQGGETLTGLNSGLEYLSWALEDTVAHTHSTLTLAAQSLHDYLETEQWAQTKREVAAELERLAGTLETLGHEAQRDFSRFTEELEKESERAAEHYRALSEDLAAAITELHGRGQEQLAESLSRLLQELEAVLRDRLLAEPKDQRRI